MPLTASVKRLETKNWEYTGCAQDPAVGTQVTPHLYPRQVESTCTGV